MSDNDRIGGPGAPGPHTPEPPSPPWPQTITLVRERGTDYVEIAKALKESGTGGWEYHDYRRIDGGTIILMTDRRHYNQRVLQDASVVIDQHGQVIKNRYGPAGIDAGTELLEQAVPVFAGGESLAQKRGQEFHRVAEGDDPGAQEGLPAWKWTLALASLALVLAVAGLLDRIIG